jgi:hypothetical protein
MAVDLPWLNALLPETFFSTYDVMPFGYHLYFVNMNLAAMSLITCLIFIMLFILGYCLLGNSAASQIKIKAKGKTENPNYNFIAFKEFLLNFFCFGFVFAGFSSLLGAFLNTSSILTLSGLFYILGIVVFGLCLSEAIVSLIKSKRVARVRVASKAIFLAAAGLNPLYLSAIAITSDFVLIVVEYISRKKSLICPKAWLFENIFVTSSLTAFYFIPDSFLTLGITVALLSLGLAAEVYQYCCERSEINRQIQLFEAEQDIGAEGKFWAFAEIDKKGSSKDSELDLDEKIQEK